MNRVGLAPLERDQKADFSRASEDELVRQKVLHILLTEPGELPWHTEFGAGLGRLRHQANAAVLQEVARVYVRNALARWLPSVRLAGIVVQRREEVLTIQVTIRHTERALEVGVTL